MRGNVKLVASLITRNELDRYLPMCIEHLLEFCDEIRVLDDHSDDGTSSYLTSLNSGKIHVSSLDSGTFFDHEGHARQVLIDWTLQGSPTHVLAIDADEFISDGQELRKQIESHEKTQVFTLCMQEVWRADEQLSIRMDGGWVPHEVTVVWSPPLIGRSTIRNQALACGRVPKEAEQLTRRGASFTGVSILHFGWACEVDRQKRYDRYAVHDGGNFHASTHLNSIMWPDHKVNLCRQRWPMALKTEQIRRRANRA